MMLFAQEQSLLADEYPQPWAEATLGSARLGDRRRTHRLVQLAAGVAQRPTRHISDVFSLDNDVSLAWRQALLPWVLLQKSQFLRKKRAKRLALGRRSL